jgi:hypothetical protein
VCRITWEEIKVFDFANGEKLITERQRSYPKKVFSRKCCKTEGRQRRVSHANPRFKRRPHSAGAPSPNPRVNGLGPASYTSKHTFWRRLRSYIPYETQLNIHLFIFPKELQSCNPLFSQTLISTSKTHPINDMWGRGGAGNIAQVEEAKRLRAQRAKAVRTTSSDVLGV